jgi:hypothetical protein
VLDSVSGDPVTHATVTAGTVSSSSGGNNGVYTLSVPLLPNDQTTANTPFEGTPKALSVQADGYLRFADALGLIANETVRRTVFLVPNSVIIEGVIRVESFQGLFDLSQIQVQAANITVGAVSASANTALFRIPDLPASNSSLTRTINLRFTHPDLQTVVLSNIVLPRAGERSLPLTVVMRPITVDIVGSVLDSGSLPPNGQAVLVRRRQRQLHDRRRAHA